MTLTEFLLERIAEDEAVATAASMYRGSVHVDNAKGWKDAAAHKNRFPPARQLAEVAAKRAIMNLHMGSLDYYTRDEWMTRDYCVGCGQADDVYAVVEDVNDCPVLRALAAIYSSNPAYNPEWSLA